MLSRGGGWTAPSVPCLKYASVLYKCSGTFTSEMSFDISTAWGPQAVKTSKRDVEVSFDISTARLFEATELPPHNGQPQVGWGQRADGWERGGVGWDWEGRGGVWGGLERCWAGWEEGGFGGKWG